MHRHFRSVWLVLAITALCGCSSGDGRVAIEGQITIDGQPLEMAAISFLPLEEHGRSSGASVENGRFQLDARDGLPPGTYRVQVQAFRKTGRTGLDPQRGVEIPETAPIVLQNTTGQQITVKANGENKFSLAFASATR
jgi:hypothetical protein